MATRKARLVRFPDELEALLSPRGLRFLEGKDSGCGAMLRQPFFSGEDLIDPARARACASILGKAFGDLMQFQNEGLPSPWEATRSGGDVLPKVGRFLTTPLEGDDSADAVARGQECGLVQMIGSDSYAAFVAQLAGAKVHGPTTLQVLANRAGDYAGPHTDHHPESETLRGGYLDVHLTFCTPGVRQQLLVYEHNRHFNTVQPIAKSGTLTAYRLPLWHYTTPLQVKPGAEATARRWLVLTTFEHPRPAATGA